MIDGLLLAAFSVELFKEGARPLSREEKKQYAKDVGKAVLRGAAVGAVPSALGTAMAVGGSKDWKELRRRMLQSSAIGAGVGGVLGGGVGAIIDHPRAASRKLREKKAGLFSRKAKDTLQLARESHIPEALTAASRRLRASGGAELAALKAQRAQRLVSASKAMESDPAIKALRARLAKTADDPAEVLLPKVKGLASPRKATPRLRKGTKGQIPVNPFSGNWVKAPPKLATTVGDIHAAKSIALDPVHAGIGLAAILGTGLVAGKTLKAIASPWDEDQTPSTRAQSAAIHGARGIQSALSAPTARLLSS